MLLNFPRSQSNNFPHSDGNQNRESEAGENMSLPSLQKSEYLSWLSPLGLSHITDYAPEHEKQAQDQC